MHSSLDPAYLATISDALLASLELETTIQRIAELAVPVLADCCTIHLLTPQGAIKQLAVAHHDPAKVALIWELERRHPIDPTQLVGIPRVLFHNEPDLVPEVEDARMELFAKDEEHLRMLRELRLHSSLCLPLRARGMTFGTITFMHAESGRQYGAEDVAPTQELARRAAIAVDNARLYEAEQAARHRAEQAARRTALLQAVTASLGSALAPMQVADIIVEQGVAALGANAGLVARVTEQGDELELLRSIGYDQPVIQRWQRFPLDIPLPIAACVRTGEPIWLGSREVMIARYPAIEREVSNSSNQATASLPLQVDGKSIGVLGLSFAEPQDFTADDRAFMLALAHQCAQALERARLYEAERQARKAAEAAIRARDDFLSIAAHELKTPVTTLLGYSQVIQRRIEREQQIADRDRRGLEVIASQATRLSTLIDSLLDVSRIQQGHFTLDRRPLDLCALVRRAVEEVQPTLDRHVIQISCPDDGLMVEGDALRLEQILQNLIQNAIKYSPEGGTITVSAEQDGGNVAIAVRDQGIGIPEEAQARLFQRFFRAGNAAAHTVKGMGIGLYVVKEIVERHGGSVSVQSSEGTGSTFTIHLPLVPPVHDQAQNGHT